MRGATLAAANSALAKRWRSALGITCNLLSDGISIFCRNSRAATRRSSRRRSLYELAHQATIPTLQCRLSNRGRSGTIANAARAGASTIKMHAEGTSNRRGANPGAGRDRDYAGFSEAARKDQAMIDETHSPARRSWVASANAHADFPIQNLPLCVFAPPGGAARGGVAIGDEIFDL